MRTVGRQIEFPFHDRPRLQISNAAKIRVHPDDHVLRLRPDAAGRYPTDADLYIRGPLINPTAVRLWRAIQIHAEEVAVDGVAVATVRYRLNDGSADRWWNGSAWAAPTSGQWNTQAEIQAHLQAFPVASRQLRIVFGLRSTDARYTPTVRSAMLLFDADVLSDLEEILYRSLAQHLRTIRCPVEVAITWPGGSTADLDLALRQIEPVQFDGVLAAFDYTADPGCDVDLLAGYNATTHVVTLSTATTAGHRVVIRLSVEPDVAFTTHADYNEVGRLPAIAIEGATEHLVADPPAKQAAVNVGTLEAHVVKAPRQSDYVVDLRLIAARGLDLLRLSDAVKTWLVRNRSLRIAALDATATVVVDRQIDASPRPDEIQIDDRLSIRLKNVECWIYPVETGHGVGRLVVSGSLDATV